jgi:hypothetical protein
MDVVHSHNAVGGPVTGPSAALELACRVIPKALSGLETPDHEYLPAILIAKVSLQITRLRSCSGHESNDTERNSHAEITESLLFHGRAL